MPLVRGYCSGTLWEGKSQSVHQDFKCDHYETGKTGRKNNEDILYLADRSLFRNQFGELKVYRVPGYAQFCINQQKQEEKYHFQQGIKPSNGSKNKIHFIFIHTCRISPDTKNKSKKQAIKLMNLKIRIFIMHCIMHTYPPNIKNCNPVK